MKTANLSPPAVDEISENRAAPKAVSFVCLTEFPAAMLELAWRDLLARCPLASHYTSPEFFREPYLFANRPFAILAIASGSVLGVLTGIHKGTTVHCGVPTRPQILIHPMANQQAILSALWNGLTRESRHATLVHVYTWSGLPLPSLREHGFRLRVMDGNCVLNLQPGPTAVFAGFSKSRRAGIRWAIRHGVEVFQATTPEHFSAFYAIYVKWCKSKRLPCHSYALEHLAFATTQGNRALFLASYQGVIVAGDVVRFLPGGLIECSRNNSLPEYLHLKPNDLLLWRSIEWACALGFHQMSMGASHQFLREYGGPIVPILRYRKDQTVLRWHDGFERLVDLARWGCSRLPTSWEHQLRHLLGKPLPCN